MSPIQASWLLVPCVVLLIAACQSPSALQRPGDVAPARTSPAGDPESGENNETIYVTSNGWHSAIVVSRASLPRGAIPEGADFPSALYLSLSWGDAEYFPERQPTFAMGLRAALGPTPAVVHLAGLRSHPQDVFPSDEVVQLRIPTDRFGNLVTYLDGTFARNGAKRARSIAPGLYSFSLFYRAKGEFHLLNTCNTWTARGLKAGGWPIRVSGTVSAEDLMAQVRRLAERRNAGPPTP
jgi:uncharacterized protein (TIGR02117 family)